MADPSRTSSPLNVGRERKLQANPVQESRKLKARAVPVTTSSQ
jgi:hypothetical protein